MPPALVRAAPEDLKAVAELMGRNCKLWDYTKVPVPSFKLKTDFIAYSSPDSTYAVTKKLFDGAKSSILIGIYDFTAEYIEQLVLKAMGRGVKTTLMLDLDNRTGENEIFEKLRKRGCRAVPSPSCASQNGAEFFAASHEKVVVIDDEWVLVQSGNYSDASIPQNETDGGDPDDFTPGNRDMGVAVRSKELASFFSNILESDIKLELGGAPEAEALGDEMLEGAVALFEAAPSRPPEDLFPSKRFKPGAAVRVQPILSPDNYMDEIPKWLRGAKRSVFIEQQYIRGAQDKIRECLSAIVAARKASPKLDVRIVLAKPRGGKKFAKEANAIKALGNKPFGLKMGKNVRILSTRHFVHCHNKLIIVDGKAILISSQNWSDAALVKNREAGLILHYPEMARHYARIFESDWRTAEKTLKVKKAKPELFGPEAFGTGKVVPISPGDYDEFPDDDPETFPSKGTRRTRHARRRAPAGREAKGRGRGRRAKAKR